MKILFITGFYFINILFNRNYVNYDPLEQFDLIKFFFSFNNAVIFLIMVCFLCIIFLFLNSSKKFKWSSYYLNFYVYSFVKALVLSKVENRVLVIRYLPIFYYLFIFILISNFVGIVPFTYTITSMLILPFFLSTTFFGGVIIIGIRKHKLNFFAGFLPSGVPSFIAPFLIVIEFISYVMRVFSLAIRLFANILSGHILIKILISVCWSLFYSLLLAKVFFGFVSLVLIVAIMFLEVIVCVLQAYVFVSLISMYLDEALKFSQH